MECSGYIQAEHLPNTIQKISINYIFQIIIYPISGDDPFEIINL
jgi:hypothetical protein